MNTLQEIGEFVGLYPRTVSMRSAGDLVSTLNSTERTSMQAMILGLQNLPPISLDAEVVGLRYGDVPFTPVFRIQPSNGAILETSILIYANGLQPEESKTVGNSGDFGPITLHLPGIFFMEVRRIGITNTGRISLAKYFHIEGVTPPPPPIPPTIPPFIWVTSNGDGSFKVSGTGFLPKMPVTFRIVDAQNPLTKNIFLPVTSNIKGAVEDFPTGYICLAGGIVLAFSAEDGRVENGQAIVSNPVTITCPFPKPDK